MRPPSSSDERLKRRFERRIETFMHSEGLMPPDGRLLVAVSGGADSSALLLALSAIAEPNGLRLRAAYFDHGLRGAAAAAAEREAVRRLAQMAGVPLDCGAGDVAGLAKAERLSLEDAARHARYAFLAECARRNATGAVATGHTRDDQAETVLMRIVRGAGLRGLAAMAPRSPWPFPQEGGLVLVRPLLSTSRAETTAYCRARSAEPVADESNLSPAFLRNRLRNEVLPILRELNPSVDDALVRLAEGARLDVEFIEGLAGGLFERRGDEVVLSRDALRGAPVALRRHAVRLAIEALAGDLREVSERHLRAIERIAVAPAGGKRVVLPGGVEAETHVGSLILRLGPPPIAPLPEGEVLLPVPGEVVWGGLRFRAGDAPLSAAIAHAVADARTVGQVVRIRRRRPGDRIQPSGMTGTKKLQDLFVDARVPRPERDAVPIFEGKSGIVWVGGLRTAAWAQPRAGSDCVVLSYRREDQA